MGELLNLPNIGEDTERQLNEVGVYTKEELEDLGAEQAWLRLQRIDPSACIHRLLGLEGAVRGMKKTLLPKERKAELSAFYKAHKL